MLNFMLGVASLSILLSLVDLVSSMKAMVRWRRKREMFMEEMSKGEQSSMFTTTTMTEDNDVLLIRDNSPSGSSKNGLKDAAAVVPNGERPHAQMDGENKTGESTNERRPESRDAKTDMSLSPTPMSTPVPGHFVLHRPPLSPRPDRVPPPNPRVPAPMGVKKQGQHVAAGANSGHQSDSSDSQDKRAWV